jgi:hypothetical protein
MWLPHGEVGDLVPPRVASAGELLVHHVWRLRLSSNVNCGPNVTHECRRTAESTRMDTPRSQTSRRALLRCSIEGHAEAGPVHADQLAV